MKRSSRVAIFASLLVSSGLACETSASAAHHSERRAGTGYSVTGLFVSPAGIVYRPTADGRLPFQAWFAEVDTNHDGFIDWAEFHADFMRAFELLDANHDGEIGPDEIGQYEAVTFPEMTATGSGALHYGLLAITHPLMSADANFNRGIDRAEWEQAAAVRWAALTQGRPGGRLSLADVTALRQEQARPTPAPAAPTPSPESPQDGSQRPT